MIPAEAIEEFKAAWRAEYGEEIDDDTARAKATNLLELLAVVCQEDVGSNHDHGTDETNP